MKQYLDLLRKVHKEGSFKDDRTGTGTQSMFGTQSRYDLSKGFPLLTTKKVNFKAIVVELLWFIKGDTNIKYLVDNDVHIWNEWPYEIFKKSCDYDGKTLLEFAQRIRKDDDFAKIYGELGPVYGTQWRNFNGEGVDQLARAINLIKHNPNSRRIIISAWNPVQIDKMVLPPCHTFFQFYVKDGKLSLQLYQRSADLFLGVPFNIASYSLLVFLIAQITSLKVGDFVHTIGDLHIYSNHHEQVNKQLQRAPRALPQLVLNKNIKKIENFTITDISLKEYHPHPGIRAKVAV